MAEGTDGRRTDTRDRLVRVATGLFRRRGVGNVGVATICQRAGTTKGVFSHHFPGGKDELVLAVIDRNDRTVRQALERSGRSSRPTAQVVAAMFTAYAEEMRNRGTDFGCPIAAAVVNRSAESESIGRRAGTAFDAWRDLISSRVGPANAELVVAALEGGILLARAADDPAILDRLGAHLAATITLPDQA